MGLRRLDRHGARPTNGASPRLRRQSLRVPSRTAARLDQQVRAATALAVPRAIPLTCTPLRRATCYPPALAIQTWGSGAIRGAAQGGSVYGGLCGRACGARGGSRCRKGVGGRVGNIFIAFLPVQCLTPPVRAFCVSRDRGGGGGGGSGPSTVSTRALVAAGSAASGGGAGGGAPCALRPV